MKGAGCDISLEARDLNSDPALCFLAGGVTDESFYFPEPQGPYCQKHGSHSAILHCKLLTCITHGGGPPDDSD